MKTFARGVWGLSFAVALGIMFFCLMALFASVGYGADLRVNCIKLLNGKAVSASGNVATAVIDMDELRTEGYFSVQLTTAGASSQVRVECEMSADGENFQEPNGATDIVSSHGPGTAIYKIDSPVVARYMRLRVTETAGFAVTSATLYLCYQ